MKLLLKLVDPRMATPYHLITFLGIVPGLLAGISYVLASRMAHGPIFWPLFIIACILGVMMLEDLLFFVLNTVLQARFPDALPRLLRGEASWHPRWVAFSFITKNGTKSFMLPDFYVEFPFVIALLLALQSWMAS